MSTHSLLWLDTAEVTIPKFFDWDVNTNKLGVKITEGRAADVWVKGSPDEVQQWAIAVLRAVLVAVEPVVQP